MNQMFWRLVYNLCKMIGLGADFAIKGLFYLPDSGASSPARWYPNPWPSSGQPTALHLGLAGAAILKSGQSRRKVLVRLHCPPGRLPRATGNTSDPIVRTINCARRDGESGETWDRQALGEPCIRHARNMHRGAGIAKSRQSALDEQAGVDEGIADTVAVTDELGLELPALRTAPASVQAGTSNRQGITVDCGVNENVSCP